MGLKEFLGEYGSTATFPAISGRYKGKKLVIVADSECVWRDLEAFGCRSDRGRGKVEKQGWDFLTVNKMVETFPGTIEHCYSNEPSFLRKCIAARRQEYTREFEGPRHVHSITPGADWVWPFGGHGTSGLGAALCGVGLGYDEIVICGMPLDDGPHNGEPHWRKTAFATSEAAGGKRTDRNPHWERAIALAFEGKVTSMSGRTRKWIIDFHHRVNQCGSYHLAAQA